MKLKMYSRFMDPTELEAFLKMTHKEIFQDVSTFGPGVVRSIMVITVVNAAIVWFGYELALQSIAYKESLALTTWLVLLYLLISTGWCFFSFPSPETAVRLCDEQDALKRKYR